MRKALFLVSAAFVAFVPMAVQAADEPDNGGDIVVTARKRGEERLQDIPASITALGGDDLQKAGNTKFTDIAYKVPGLTFTDQGPGLKRYTLRGVRSAGQEQVAVYYDEVPVPGIQSSTGDSGSQIGDFQLYDLDRIEVLKGPQSTTFGANAQTGAVRFILKKPVLDAVEGSMQVDGNSMAHGGLGGSFYGMVNVPVISDTLGVRVVGYYDHTAGYIDNVRLNDKNINSDDTAGIRALVRWKPSPTTTVDLMAWYQKRNTHGASEYHPFDTFKTSGDTSNPGYKDNVPSFAYFDTGEYKSGFYVKTPRPDRQAMYAATLSQDIGDFAALTATGSIYTRKYQYYRDNTYSIISLNSGPAGATCIKGTTCLRPDLFKELTDQTQTMNQKTAEIRLNSVGTGPFQWLVGGFYRNRNSDFRSYSPLVDNDGEIIHASNPPTGFSTAVGAGIEDCNPCGFARVNNRKIEEEAFFGEATYDIIPSIEVMGGLRWFRATQSDFGATLFQSPLLGSTLPTPYDRDFTESKLIKKGQISWKPADDVTIYVLASQGFRLGGTNQAATINVPDGYESDSLWNYEAGLKSSWFDRKLIVNISAYRVDWSNIQVSGRDITGAFAFIGNAGAARFEGMEFEVNTRPLHGLELSGGFNWLPKHELTEDQITTTFAAAGRKGDKIPYVPTFTGNFTAQYSTDLGIEGWSGYFRGDYSYRGKSGTELRPTATTYRTMRPYSLVNLRVGADSENGLGFAFYVNNLFDKAGDVYITASTGAPTSKITNQPRTVGVTVSKTF
ncbi:TonB-dependent receptor [Novosphingobium sp. BL-52-GroH]|uniref:TonB-dependent receptor n=1 Tax=Novosphingobium sp. BL-52-GroH TaxID=3349877 RepID=UPI00384DD118